MCVYVQAGREGGSDIGEVENKGRWESGRERGEGGQMVEGGN